MDDLAAAMDPASAPAPDATEPQTVIDREAPTPDAARAALVTLWQDRVRRAREHWESKAFRRMRSDMAFAAGRQWAVRSPMEAANDTFLDDPGERYVANIVLRHINQRVAAIYGKNPKVVARRKERMMNTVWDGTGASLQAALQAMSAGLPDPQAMAILQDAAASMEEQRKLNKIAKTLEILFAHEIDEQAVNFKVQMKHLVRRGLTTGVAYAKVGYQRVMGRNPDVEARLSDMSQQLDAIQRMSADIADGEVAVGSEIEEQLRLTMEALSKQAEIIVREGLTISFPDSTALIPDTNIRQLRGWVGANWVAEEYFLTSERIKELYQIDVKASGTAYVERNPGEFRPTSANDVGDKDIVKHFCVWEVFNKEDGLVYLLCDGYGDFLREPSTPDVWLEHFYPWQAYVTNEVYDDENIFPPSDVSLMRDMQLELNRARQGLREHRRASRPKTFTRAGLLEDDDKEKIKNCEAHELIELNGLQPGEKVEDVLQAYAGPQIDPRLYDVNPAFEDYLRVLGQQEANLGGTSGATATEASIAEGSRVTTVSSTVDDLDEFLTDLSRAAGQILLREASAEKVREVVGPGAVWPDLSRDQIAKEIYLEVEAASTGRPNRAQEIQNAQQVFPLLMQIPGLSPEWLARELLRRMDDRLDLQDAFADGMPSIQMINRAKQLAATPDGSNPDQQGDEGAANAPSTDPGQVNMAPRPPAGPPEPGPSGPQI